MKIGICRALHSYHHFPLWRSFFERLGFEVVLSRKTDKGIVARGVELSPAELCLPVKVFLGQVDDLRERVDLIFVPRLVCRRLSKDFYFGCPKAIGLPDMVRAIFPKTNGIFEITIDQRVGDEGEGFVTWARTLGIKNGAARRAFLEAREAEKKSAKMMGSGAIPVDFFEERAIMPKGDGRGKGERIGVIGHPYLLFDEHISLNLLKIIQGLGVEPVVPFVSEEGLVLEATRGNVPNWFYELELLAAARKVLQDREIKGLLLVFSFACGTAPVMNEIIRREIGRNSRLPILTLFFDEHSGEVGLRTRLESFVDLVRARDGNL
ncbi:MAG: acyl-CoA dehydratase activase-related protein [candidate division WOR-3 bacterium]